MKDLNSSPMNVCELIPNCYYVAMSIAIIIIMMIMKIVSLDLKHLQ